jgi:hypothetical protein
VATDELNTPLGLKKNQAQFRPPPYAAPAVAGFLGAIIATFAIWAIFNTDPLGGEPMGVAKVEVAAEGEGSARPSGPPDRDAQAKSPQEDRGPEKPEKLDHKSKRAAEGSRPSR